MSTLNISLPEEMRAYIDQQLTQRGYSTASEYLRDLIRQDQRRKAQEELETKLLEGLRSEPRELAEEDWQAIRREALKRLDRKNAA